MAISIGVFPSSFAAFISRMLSPLRVIRIIG
jgi:hypothetical protein